MTDTEFIALGKTPTRAVRRPPRNSREAVRYLRYDGHHHSRQHAELVLDGRKSLRWYDPQTGATAEIRVHPDVLAFGLGLCREAHKIDIPLYVARYIVGPEEQEFSYFHELSSLRFGQSPFNYGLACEIKHSVLGDILDIESRKVVRHLAEMAMEKVKVTSDNRPTRSSQAHYMRFEQRETLTWVHDYEWASGEC